MKSEKGITLTVLVIYVAVFTMVMVVLANISNYVYGNIKYINDRSVDATEFNKFNTYFIKSVKTSKDVEVKTISNGIQITFANGDIYQYIKNEKNIYKNKQKIAKNIKNLTAQKLVDTAGSKRYIRIGIEVGQKEETSYTKTIDYVLKYW